MTAGTKKATRKRSATGEMLERAWWRDLHELNAREAAHLPPQPDPTKQPREFVQWMQRHAQRELSPERQQLMDDMRKIPSLRYIKRRDVEIWSWVSELLTAYELGLQPHNPRTCKLGANPANDNARPSKVLRDLIATLADRGYPDVDARRLFYAIYNWPKREPPR